VTTAIAHPNIALIKYWGKVPGSDNVPASPSLSITLDTLMTKTTVVTATVDSLVFNGEASTDAKIDRFLLALRAEHEIPPLLIETSNNFPTGAGLASSASGFAALITALNAHCGLGFDATQCSSWARRGSGSAARSLFGGYATLEPPQWHATPLLSASAWPLTVVIAITETSRKSVSSTAGMERSRTTSPFYDAWLKSTTSDFGQACRAVIEQDFHGLAELSVRSALSMHAVMLSSTPPLLYWNPASVAVIQRLLSLRETGLAVFFTIDAGPQIKAVCLPDAVTAVMSALRDVPGVRQLVQTGLGGPARVIDD
jgi:diphosphomevalonate decarboxylase